ncbi:MAG: putative 4-hydroxybenzoate polyprenyltransferase [Candidatus Obscuribacterales bacterium]|nr:putative 4-hydroxybenzoate polyprenyltransferase [Candidatus Obscuribacterales bacterium]
MSSITAPDKTLKEWAEMVKIEHTVFALPFALSGLILAAGAVPPIAVIAFTILAFVGARAAAMTLNRLIDAEIDRKNPRTSDRAIPAGRISRRQALFFTIASFALMIGSATQLPPLCLMLSPIAVIWLSFYSFTKRFTWLCHIVLGIALGGAALGGWIAAGGSLDLIDPWLLALSVATWVAGFDIIYACQDVSFDQEEKLHSMPARFGVGTALWISRALHIVTVSGLLSLGLNMQLGPFFFIGIALVTIMLVYEHSIVKSDDLSRVNAAFFTINGIVSILAFVAILVDRLLA